MKCLAVILTLYVSSIILVLVTVVVSSGPCVLIEFRALIRKLQFRCPVVRRKVLVVTKARVMLAGYVATVIRCGVSPVVVVSLVLIRVIVLVVMQTLVLLVL